MTSGVSADDIGTQDTSSRAPADPITPVVLEPPSGSDSALATTSDHAAASGNLVKDTDAPKAPAPAKKSNKAKASQPKSATPGRLAFVQNPIRTSLTIVYSLVSSATTSGKRQTKTPRTRTLKNTGCLSLATRKR